MLDSRQVALNLPLRRRCLFLRDVAFLDSAFHPERESVQSLRAFLRDTYTPQLVGLTDFSGGSEDLWRPLLSSAHTLLRDLEQESVEKASFFEHWDEFLESSLYYLDLLIPQTNAHVSTLVRIQGIVRDAVTHIVLMFYDEGTAFYRRSKAAQLLVDTERGLNNAQHAEVTFSITAPVSSDVYNLFTAS